MSEEKHPKEDKGTQEPKKAGVLNRLGRKRIILVNRPPPKGS